jgi:hypothetical protein
MVFQVLSGFPLLLEVQDVFILHVHVAIAAYAAALAPDRAKYRYYRLKDFLAFFDRHRHLNGTLDHGRSPRDVKRLMGQGAFAGALSGRRKQQRRLLQTSGSCPLTMSHISGDYTIFFP